MKAIVAKRHMTYFRQRVSLLSPNRFLSGFHRLEAYCGDRMRSIAMRPCGTLLKTGYVNKTFRFFIHFLIAFFIFL
jgi:hypothetical protein